MVYTTFPTLESARLVARALVDARLAACVNILPGMVSIYRWNGAISEDGEVAMLIKTQRELVDRVIDEVGQRHPYATPAIVAYDIAAGSAVYLDWISEMTRAGAV
ncbi:MAG: divalent-cation tolerance protein CutA [Hyphomicrobiaceae bacterium]|nr:divalent-cation tolerance protein CutA [Hyphomicrobiaceae bacterium]